MTEATPILRCGEETTHNRESSFYGSVHRHGPTGHEFKPTQHEEISLLIGCGDTSGLEDLSEEIRAALATVEADLYLDWLNNYLSVEAFAAGNSLTREAALAVIEKGREAHEERAHESEVADLEAEIERLCQKRTQRRADLQELAQTIQEAKCDLRKAQFDYEEGIHFHADDEEIRAAHAILKGGQA